MSSHDPGRPQLRHLLLALTGTGILTLIGCVTPAPPAWHPLDAADLNRPLSVTDCLRLARQSDLHLAEWKARIETARADLDKAREIPNPTFQGTWEDWGLRDAAGMSLGTSTYGLAYPIFFWWTRGKEIRAADRHLRAEKAAVHQDQRKLAIEIGTAYFALLAADRKASLTEKLLQNADESLRLARESKAVGIVSGHELELAETEAREVEGELFTARREARSQSLAMAFALGAAQPMEVHPVEMEADPLIAAAVDQTTESLPQSLVTAAMRADPARAQALAAREAAEASLEVEYRRRLPLTEAQASAARKRDPEGWARNFSFDIPIPLFNWNRSGVNKAKAELLAAQTAEEKARRDVVARLSESWETYQSEARYARLYAGPLIRSRAKLARDARELFHEGQSSYTEMLQATRDWRTLELATIDHWRERQTAAWKIHCEIAGDLTE